MRDRPWRDALAGLFARFGGGLSQRLSKQTPLWTHNDWHPSNLLWTPEGRVASIFDFGLATQSCALHDLATAIERSAIAWLEGVGLDDAPITGDAETALALIAGYREVLPLSREDVDTLVDLLPLVHVEFALSEVDYFAGILKDEAQAGLAWDTYLIGHAAWFASAPGHAFLRDVRAGVDVGDGA